MDTPLARIGPKDVFLQLLLIVTLYLSATHLGALCFQLINRVFPDPALGEVYARESIASAARWAIAMLIVSAPIFFLLTRYLRTEYAAHPEKLAMRTRRWFVAFTLFAAALVTIGDLVAVINQFLQGDLTARFTLKALTILIIAGAVITYERWEFSRVAGAPVPPRILALRWGAIVVTIAMIVVGFVTVGSPRVARLARIDDQRAAHLSELQWQIVQYWQQRNMLPATLDALRDEITGFVPPTDPETNAPYEYRAVETLSFELCAVFATESNAPQLRAYRPYVSPPGDSSFEIWKHGEGQTCFRRTIDPAKYRLPSPIPVPEQPFVRPVE